MFWAGAVAIVLLFLGYYKLTWGSYFFFNKAIDVWTETFPDFARYYYPMGQAILQSGMPIEGFVYSPFVAVMLAAFGLLQLSTATLIWGTLQVAAIVLYVVLIRRLVPARLPLQLLSVALVVSSFPLIHTFRWGQVTLFVTVALLGMLVCYARGRLVAAAALFAFAVSFKWYPLVFLALFVARRDWRFLLWAAAAGALLLVAVPVVFLGFEHTLRYYDALRVAYGGFGWAATSYNSQYFPHVIMRLAVAGWGDVLLRIRFLRQFGLPLLQVISWGVVVANVLLVFRLQRAGMRHANLWSAVLLFLSIPFLLGTSWPVDLVSMPFSQAFLAWAVLHADAAGLRGNGASRARLAAAGVMVLLSMVSSNVVLFNAIGDSTTYGSLGFVFWADMLLVLAVYVLLLPQVSRRSQPDAEPLLEARQPVPQD